MNGIARDRVNPVFFIVTQWYALEDDGSTRDGGESPGFIEDNGVDFGEAFNDLRISHENVEPPENANRGSQREGSGQG